MKTRTQPPKAVERDDDGVIDRKRVKRMRKHTLNESIFMANEVSRRTFKAAQTYRLVDSR